MDPGRGKMVFGGGFVIYLKYCAMLSFLGVLAVGVITCVPQDPVESGGDDEPLLLVDGPEEEPDEGMADNSRCHVCHINYADEWLAVRHAKAGMKCEQCHGSSDAHTNDEDNVTPPEIMYPLEKINGFCIGCHSEDSLDEDEHKTVLAGTAKEKKYCTDCHGDHRLEHRTRRWDRRTGKLIEDDKVRMITDMPEKK